MARNDQKPIEEADLWDILDWDVTVALSLAATADPRDDRKALAWPWMARQLVEAEPKGLAQKVFHDLCVNYISGGGAERKQQAAEIALMLGATNKRLIAYLRYKGVRFS